MRSGCFSWLPELLRVLPAGGAPGPTFRSVSRWLLGAASLAACAGAAVLAARGPLASAADELADEGRFALLLAALCAPLVPGATAAAWRSVLAFCGEPLTYREAWNCYGLGSLANTFLPGRLGEAVRIDLVSATVLNDFPAGSVTIADIDATEDDLGPQGAT